MRIEHVHYHHQCDGACPQHNGIDPAVTAVQDLLTLVEREVAQPFDSPDWFDWIPLPVVSFLAGMNEARRLLGPGEHSFLDVGSGIGSKLVIARKLGWRTFGLERHEPYVDISRRLAPESPLIVCNALAYDGYGDVDLVYAYRPCRDDEKSQALADRIMSQLHDDALFFAASGPFPQEGERVGTTEIWRRGDDLSHSP